MKKKQEKEFWFDRKLWQQMHQKESIRYEYDEKKTVNVLWEWMKTELQYPNYVVRAWVFFSISFAKLKRTIGWMEEVRKDAIKSDFSKTVQNARFLEDQPKLRPK